MEGDQEGWSTVLGQAGEENLDLVYEIPILSPGQLIWARFRCSNEIGWSDYSEANYLRLARVPSRPPKPLYIGSDSSSISIEVLPSDNNGGSTITDYEIWAETGGASAEDSAYDGSVRYHTLTGLTSGAIYRITVRSENAEGYSEFSE